MAPTFRPLVNSWFVRLATDPDVVQEDLLAQAEQFVSLPALMKVKIGEILRKTQALIADILSKA